MLMFSLLGKYFYVGSKLPTTGIQDIDRLEVEGDGNVVINGNGIFIDGEMITSISSTDRVRVNQVIFKQSVGNVDTASADVFVEGNCSSIKTSSGNVTVNGSVLNKGVSTMSGDVDVSGDIMGDVSTMSGNISNRRR